MRERRRSDAFGGVRVNGDLDGSFPLSPAVAEPLAGRLALSPLGRGNRAVAVGSICGRVYAFVGVRGRFGWEEWERWDGWRNGRWKIANGRVGRGRTGTFTDG